AADGGVDQHVGGVFGCPGDLLFGVGARTGDVVGVVEDAGARVGHCPVDVLVGPAPAQMPGEGAGDLRPVGTLGSLLLPPPVVEGGGLDHETRRAVAALEGVVGDEGGLDGVEPAIGGQAFHGAHVAAFQL